MGTIFANGLQEQCQEVEKYVLKMLSIDQTTTCLSRRPRLDNNNNNDNNMLLKINVVGLSRGGIAAIKLAQLLSYIPSNQLEMNLLLFDPVPGNLISTTRFIDLFSFNTANSSLDMSYCHHIQDVLALYPYEPLPDMAFHAPVFPKYPPRCHVVEDATLGCHQGALFCSKSSIESRLSFFRIYEWLENHGTSFHNEETSEFSISLLTNNMKLSLVECKNLMDEAIRPSKLIGQEVIRYTHSSPPGTVIIRHGLKTTDVDLNVNVPRYLNKYHKELTMRLNKCSQEESDDRDYYLLEIRRS